MNRDRLYHSLLQKIRDELTGDVQSTQLIRRIASEARVSPTSLRDFFYKHGGDIRKTEGHQRLTDEQLHNLELLVIAFSITNNPLQVREIPQLVQDAYGVKVSESWARAWKKTHSKLFKQRKAKLLTVARDSDRLAIEGEDFCDAVEEVQQRFTFSERTVVNADETRIMVGSEGKIVLEFEGRQRSNVHGMKNHTICSMLTFFQADGTVLMSVYCLPSAHLKSDQEGKLLQANFFSKHEDCLRRTQWPRFYTFTESGYFNKATWECVFHEFVDLWRLRNPSLHCFLFVDNLNVHIQPNLAVWGIDAGVFFMFLVRNATHMLQPADSYPFAILKNAIYTKVGAAICDATFEPNKQLPAIWNEVYDAEQSAFSAIAVKKAFTDTCLCPWTRDGVMHLIQKNAGKFSAETLTSRDNETVQRVAEFLRGRTARTEKRAKGVVPINAVVEKNICYTAFQLEQKTAELQQQQREKEEQQRQKRASEEASSAAKRLAFTCMMEGCVMRHRGGKKWAVCKDCERRYCPSHASFLRGHKCP